MEVRRYSTYKEYVDHQGSKLDKKYSIIAAHDKQYEQSVYSRYSGFEGKKVLCLAARLGGEVRAFKKLGADAIGVDLNPGKDNKDVIYGDFHDIPFKDKHFDYVFTNSIDHVLYLDKFYSEIKRVLKPRGVFICELMKGGRGGHGVIDTVDDSEIIAEADKYFEVKKIEDIRVSTTCLRNDVSIYYMKNGHNSNHTVQ